MECKLNEMIIMFKRTTCEVCGKKLKQGEYRRCQDCIDRQIRIG